MRAFALEARVRLGPNREWFCEPFGGKATSFGGMRVGYTPTAESGECFRSLVVEVGTGYFCPRRHTNVPTCKVAVDRAACPHFYQCFGLARSTDMMDGISFSGR